MYWTPPREAEEFRADFQPLNQELLPPTKPSLTIEECRALKNLVKTNSGLHLQWTRGWLWLLLTRRTIQTRPFPYWKTPVLTGSSITALLPNTKNKLAQTLRDIKQIGGLSDHSYRKVYPTSVMVQNVYV